jgi:glyoxylase-like metal-dependent hydrolase (beta-lactamase superfamily II)
MAPRVQAFFHEPTSSLSYILADPDTRRAAVIDPVLDYEARSARTATVSADKILAFVKAEALSVDWVLETHVHADHLSAAGYLRDALGAKLGIGEKVDEVQRTWGDIYNLDRSVPRDGSQFDRRFKDGETLGIGKMAVHVMHTPGHTPSCVSYLAGGCAFVGDTMFMPDYGTARCDFPGGDPAVLFRSVHAILALPAETRIHVCHDYRPGGRDLAWEATVARQKAENLHIRDGVTEAEFVALRKCRDEALPLPELLLPAVQVNIRGGRLPEPDGRGKRYLTIPLDSF